MSSYKNAAKSHQKEHRERSQPAHRQKLGPLEKKKDYKLRADDFQAKRKQIVALKRKALDKNPDEFYFKMVRTKLKDGEHQTEDSTPKYTADQIKLLQTQDQKYINYRRSIELKTIEKMKSTLHMLDAKDKPKNTHKVFLDSKKEVEKFNPSEYFDTHPSLVGRTYNRPRISTLKMEQKMAKIDNHTLAKMTVERTKNYNELSNRIERERQLMIAAQKMEVRKNLRDKKSRKKLVKAETKSNAAVYQWVPQRQR